MRRKDRHDSARVKLVDQFRGATPQPVTVGFADKVFDHQKTVAIVIGDLILSQHRESILGPAAGFIKCASGAAHSEPKLIVEADRASGAAHRGEPSAHRESPPYFLEAMLPDSGGAANHRSRLGKPEATAMCC